MAINKEAYQKIKSFTDANHCSLVAVSKIKPAADIQALYDLGQRDFGENYVQELVEKYEALPKDIQWHYIGHLQTNKVKYIAPFVHLIHGVDSEKLLAEINKQALKNNKKINCLLQVHIAEEESKFGLDHIELENLINKLKENNIYHNVNVLGLMGMGTFSDDKEKVSNEFKSLFELFTKFRQLPLDFIYLSMGMSDDYQLAIEEGSNMVRIGSLVFGARNYLNK